MVFSGWVQGFTFFRYIHTIAGIQLSLIRVARASDDFILCQKLSQFGIRYEVVRVTADPQID